MSEEASELAIMEQASDRSRERKGGRGSWREGVRMPASERAWRERANK
jgi:hypothetical protein